MWLLIKEISEEKILKEVFFKTKKPIITPITIKLIIIKIEIGSAYPLETEKTMTIRGRNLVTGLPEAQEVSSIEMREAINGPIQIIIDTIKDALDEAPPGIGVDLLDTGICMAGGSSQLQGLVQRLSAELRMHVWLADDPITCVARGAGIVLEDLDRFQHLLVDVDRSKQRPV